MTTPDKMFQKLFLSNDNVSNGITAIMTLLQVLKNDASETPDEFNSNMSHACEAVKNIQFYTPEIIAACDLFMKDVTSTNSQCDSVGELKAIVIERGLRFLNFHLESRSKIAVIADEFFENEFCILTHSKSRVVLQAMLDAAEANKRFRVFVTMSDVDKSGSEMCQALQKAGIKCNPIQNTTVGTVMDQISIIMVGAQGVVSNGGIINKVGTYDIAVCAREMIRPFYVLTESLKFLKYEPKHIQDLMCDVKYPTSKLYPRSSKEHPLVDYTPPGYITLFFTDFGIYTPSGISGKIHEMYL